MSLSRWCRNKCRNAVNDRWPVCLNWNENATISCKCLRYNIISSANEVDELKQKKTSSTITKIKRHYWRIACHGQTSNSSLRLFGCKLINLFYSFIDCIELMWCNDLQSIHSHRKWYTINRMNDEGKKLRRRLKSTSQLFDVRFSAPLILELMCSKS